MNPRILSAIAEGYNQRVRNADYMNWINGQYTLAAVTVGVERNLAGRKSKSEYPKNPFFEEIEKQNKPLSDDELQKQRELFVERLKTMQSNFEISHGKVVEMNNE
nr:MAG TPA: hypothetical protein [Caudoviricetes sp.]DAX14305.1 MAG TPA: hypothetical protein [Bacteriophage sp.]